MTKILAEPLDILNIGSEVVTKEGMEHILRSLGEVRSFYASTDKSALNSYVEKHIDVIICEYQYTGGSAQSFLQEIGGIDVLEDSYFILVCDKEQEGMETLQEELNIHSILYKPISGQKLKEQIQKYLSFKKTEQPDWVMSLIEAKLAGQNKQDIEAQELFSSLLKENTNNPHILKEYANYLNNKGESYKTEQLLKAFLSSNAKSVVILDLLGSTLVRKESKASVDEGLNLLELAQKLSPANEARLQKIAESYISISEVKVDQQLRTQQTNANAHLLKVKILVIKRKYTEAFQYIEKHIHTFSKESFKEVQAYRALCRHLGEISD